jgi:hypothetical protein
MYSSSSHRVVGVLLTGCQKLGVETQSENVDRYGKTVDGSSIFLSIFRANGIPLIPEQHKMETVRT